jgi:hypothetical protein
MTAPVSMLGEGLLAIWCEVDRTRIDELDEWHIHEHLAERVGIPGFLRARRYEQIGDETAPEVTLLTLYETQTVDVLASPAYMERLDNPTPLTRQTVPLMGRMRRSALRLVHRKGQGVGGHLTVWQFRPGESRVSDMGPWAEDVLAKALEPVAVIAAHMFAPEIAATQAKDATAEGRVTDTVEVVPPWLLLVEATTEGGVADSDRALGDVVESGADEHGVTVERYRLSITMTEPPGSQ